jgi:hypothetical protein
LNIKRILLISILVPTISVVGFFAITNLRYTYTARSVNELAKSEFDSIDLPNEFSQFREEEQSPECSYDHKVGSLRCNVRYAKYFITNNEPCTEYTAVKQYLLNSHWGLKYSDTNPEECSRMNALGYMPAELFNNSLKNPAYPLEILVKFYSEKNMKEICEDNFQAKYNVNLCRLREAQSKQTSSIYTVSIHSDFVNQ